jgi:hypothetical protein
MHFPIRAFTSDSHRGLRDADVSVEVDLKRREDWEDMGRESIEREGRRTRMLLCFGGVEGSM